MGTAERGASTRLSEHGPHAREAGLTSPALSTVPGTEKAARVHSSLPSDGTRQQCPQNETLPIVGSSSF